MISYEEAKKAFQNLYTGMFNVPDNETVKRFIEQHKPPTFWDVKKAWGKYNPKMSVVKEENGNGILILEREVVQFLHINKHGVSQFGVTNKEMTTSLFNAINITIQYLQAKEKDNEA